MTIKRKTPDKKLSSNTVEIVTQLVLRKCDKTLENGEPVEELFIRRSIQDYYVNLRESTVELIDLRAYIPKSYDDMTTVKLEVEYCEGEWEECSGMFGSSIQKGTYVIIHKIIS